VEIRSGRPGRAHLSIEQVRLRQDHFFEQARLRQDHFFEQARLL